MPTQEELKDAYSKLYDALNDAYWAASTLQDKDRIHGLAEAAFDIMSALNAADVRSRDSDYAALTQTVITVNKKLQDLTEQINNIIHSISIATSVVSAATKVIAFSGQFLA